MPYTRSTTIELVQHLNRDNMLLTLDRIDSYSGGIWKCCYYILTFHVDNKVVYAPIAESNIDRAFNQFDRLHKAILLGRN